ncbi:MAG: hypothetical protein IKZ13_00435 [Akkermansia sp.]|nr:hypothetical protein [Akkermansia sp.]
MNENQTDLMDVMPPPRSAAPLNPAYRERLLAAMLEAQAEARVETLAPAPLTEEFRARLQSCVSAEAMHYRRRRTFYLRWKYGAAACVVLCAVVSSFFSITPSEDNTSAPLQAVASRTTTGNSPGDYLDTLTIKAADNTVLRVRVPGHSVLPVSDDVI